MRLNSYPKVRLGISQNIMVAKITNANLVTNNFLKQEDEINRFTVTQIMKVVLMHPKFVHYVELNLFQMFS